MPSRDKASRHRSINGAKDAIQGTDCSKMFAFSFANRWWAIGGAAEPVSACTESPAKDFATHESTAGREGPLDEDFSPGVGQLE